MMAVRATTALPDVRESFWALEHLNGTDPDTIAALKQFRVRRRHYYRRGAIGFLVAPNLLIVESDDWPAETVPRATGSTSSIPPPIVGSLGALGAEPPARTFEPPRSLFASHTHPIMLEELVFSEFRLLAVPHYRRRVVSTSLPEAASLLVENLTGLLSAPSTFLQQQFAVAFDAAREQRFEDGMSSGFSHVLLDLIDRYGTAAVAEFERRLRGGKLNDEVLGEAIRWLAASDHRESHKYRMLLLQECLHSPSPMIRDAAALGLASMDDPAAIPALEEAITSERDPEVREGLLQVLDQLRDTARCPSS